MRNSPNKSSHECCWTELLWNLQTGAENDAQSNSICNIFLRWSSLHVMWLVLPFKRLAVEVNKPFNGGYHARLALDTLPKKIWLVHLFPCDQSIRRFKHRLTYMWSSFLGFFSWKFWVPRRAGPQWPRPSLLNTSWSQTPRVCHDGAKLIGWEDLKRRHTGRTVASCFIVSTS